MNYLGIDWGRKRIGLSYGDDLAIAMPLPAAVGPTEPERLDAIAQIIKERKIDSLVVGYPYTLKGAVGQRAEEVDAFIAELETRFALPVERCDERFSTQRAGASARAFGLKDNRSSGKLDSRAATLILQDFLDQQGLSTQSHSDNVC